MIYFVSISLNVYKKEYVLGKKKIIVGTGFAILAMLPLIWWTVTRPLSFGDSLLSS